jgi:hypothetical protein
MTLDPTDPGTAIGPVIRRRDGTIRTDSPHLREPPDAVTRPIYEDRSYQEPPAAPHIPEPRMKNPNRAGALRNNLRSIWWQMTRVAPCFLAAGIVVWLIMRWLTDSHFWAWAATIIPTVLFFVWMRLVIGQARAHYRGDAVPPPGAYRW